jgi:hypothetical protein
VANKAKPPEFRSDSVIIRKLGAQEEMASTSPHNNPDVEEARNLCALIETGAPAQQAESWQFELVRRQQQIRMRDEAQRMLSISRQNLSIDICWSALPSRPSL